MRFTGTVIVERFAEGSKSERTAVFLQTELERLLLRRVGGNAMKDVELGLLVNATVEVDGVIYRGVLLASDIRKVG